MAQASGHPLPLPDQPDTLPLTTNTQGDSEHLARIQYGTSQDKANRREKPV
jgi:hypothetical protein